MNTDKWSTTGANMLASDQLEAVRRHLETVGPVAVAWWHYRGSRSPDRLVFEDFDRFLTFVRSKPAPGDAIDVWPFPDQPESRIAQGKIPNAAGETPERGAY